jgi:hypothetical protein
MLGPAEAEFDFFFWADIAWIELEIQREFLPVRPVLIAQCCSVFSITHCCRTDTLV